MFPRTAPAWGPLSPAPLCPQLQPVWHNRCVQLCTALGIYAVPGSLPGAGQATVTQTHSAVTELTTMPRGQGWMDCGHRGRPAGHSCITRGCCVGSSGARAGEGEGESPDWILSPHRRSGGIPGRQGIEPRGWGNGWTHFPGTEWSLSPSLTLSGLLWRWGSSISISQGQEPAGNPLISKLCFLV